MKYEIGQIIKTKERKGLFIIVFHNVITEIHSDGTIKQLKHFRCLDSARVYSEFVKLKEVLKPKNEL